MAIHRDSFGEEQLGGNLVVGEDWVLYDYEPAVGVVAAEVLTGLQKAEKQISPKYFYDERGSQLFDAITQLPEYYPTRIELALFDRFLPEIKQRAAREPFCVVEYGSGSSKKIRRVLDVLQPAAYVPVDISRQYLLDNARQLKADFPELAMYPVCADIGESFALPEEVHAMRKLGFFPGSSIGNFSPEEATRFLQRVRLTLGHDAQMLIGVDAKKSVAVLEAAYNDSAGVTAEFNLNALLHLNDQLGADFNPQQFAHVARYNAELGCVQMFLRSRVAQQVTIGDASIEFAAHELIHTEDSYKYRPQDFLRVAQQAGFEQTALWQDDDAWYSIFLLHT